MSNNQYDQEEPLVFNKMIMNVVFNLARDFEDQITELQEQVQELQEKESKRSSWPRGRPPMHEKEKIIGTLESVEGNRTQAAKILGMSTRSVRRIANQNE